MHTCSWYVQLTTIVVKIDGLIIIAATSVYSKTVFFLLFPVSTLRTVSLVPVYSPCAFQSRHQLMDLYDFSSVQTILIFMTIGSDRITKKCINPNLCSRRPLRLDVHLFCFHWFGFGLLLTPLKRSKIVWNLTTEKIELEKYLFAYTCCFSIL